MLQMHCAYLLNLFSFISRLCQMVKLYLFAPSSGLYSCPLAMTDGAAKILKVCLVILHVYICVRKYYVHKYKQNLEL